MPTFLRVLSTICLALTSGAVALVVVTVLMAFFGGGKLPDDVISSWLAFVLGFVVVVVFHRRLHQFIRIYDVLSILGGLAICGGLVIYVRADVLSEAHSPTGWVLGIRYAFMMAGGIGLAILGLLLLVSAVLGRLARVISGRRAKVSS